MVLKTLLPDIFYASYLIALQNYLNVQQLQNCMIVLCNVNGESTYIKYSSNTELLLVLLLLYKTKSFIDGNISDLKRRKKWNAFNGNPTLVRYHLQ